MIARNSTSRSNDKPQIEIPRFGLKEWMQAAAGCAFMLAAFVWVFVLPICGLIYLFMK